MIYEFENVNYNNAVGNIKLKNKSLVFFTDKNSVNDEEKCIEIYFNDIDKTKFKNMLKKNTMLIVDIESNNVKYTFEFNYIDEYENFINIINKILFN